MVEQDLQTLAAGDFAVVLVENDYPCLGLVVDRLPFSAKVVFFSTVDPSRIRAENFQIPSGLPAKQGLKLKLVEYDCGAWVEAITAVRPMGLKVDTKVLVSGPNDFEEEGIIQHKEPFLVGVYVGSLGTTIFFDTSNLKFRPCPPYLKDRFPRLPYELSSFFDYRISEIDSQSVEPSEEDIVKGNDCFVWRDDQPYKPATVTWVTDTNVTATFHDDSSMVFNRLSRTLVAMSGHVYSLKFTNAPLLSEEAEEILSAQIKKLFQELADGRGRETAVQLFTSILRGDS